MAGNQQSTKRHGSEQEKNYSSGSQQDIDTDSDDLSNASEKIRRGSPEEREQGASKLGKAGGQHGHKND